MTTRTTARAIIEKVLSAPELHIGDRSTLLLKAYVDGWIHGSGGHPEDHEWMARLQGLVAQAEKELQSKSWARILHERHGDSALATLRSYVERVPAT